MSGWTAISFRYPPSLEDAVVAVLHEAGTLGMHLGESEATAYFRAGADLGTVTRALESVDGAVVTASGTVDDERWVERQEQERKPLRIGRRFEILPAAGWPDSRAGGAGAGPARNGDSGADGGGRSAALGDEAAGRIRLVIPPQRAFGTGEHETTRLCLELLENLPVRGARVLDLGTGSGILAMAAELLGAREVVGVDNDPEAIEVARENVALNACTRVRLEVGDLSGIRGPFDLIVANIYAGVLGSLAEDLAHLQQVRGRSILSGFSAVESEELEQRFAAFGYLRETLAESGPWAALVLRRA